MATGGLMAKGPPPNLPKFLLFAKIAIIVLSLIILALAAYSIAIFSTSYGVYGYSGVAGLLIFVVIKTWIIYGALTFIELRAPHLYWRIVAIVLYGISVIFWLSAWAWAASNAAFWLSFDSYYYRSSYAPFRAEGAALAACAGLGAIVWILTIVNEVLLIRACLADNGTVSHNQAELGQVHGKVEPQTSVYPVSTPAPAAQYGQPAPYGQPQQYGQPAPYGQAQQPYPSQ